MTAIPPELIAAVRARSHLTQRQIALELDIPEHRVEWIRRRYIGGDKRKYKSVSKNYGDAEWGAHNVEMAKLRESEKQAAMWAERLGQRA